MRHIHTRDLFVIVAVVLGVVFLATLWGCEMRCDHEWQIVKNVTLPSAYEQMATAEARFKFEGPPGTYRDLYGKKYILVLVCKRCGKLDKTVEVNP